MPAAVRLGDICSGHGCWPPRSNCGTSDDVFVNGLGQHRVGDPWEPHTCPTIPETHAGSAASGSSSVFVNGSPACRIGDAVDCGSTMASGSPDVYIGDKGPDGVFESRRRQWLKSGTLSEQDELLLCIPDIAEAEAGRAGSAHDAQGWLHLQEFLHKWFTGSASTDRDNATPSFVSWDWLLEFERVKTACGELAYLSYLFNKSARQQLGALLSRDGFLGTDRVEFNYIDVPASQLKPGYFQHITVDAETNPVDGLTASLGTFAICAVAAGWVEPIVSNSGLYQVTVSRVAFYVQDSFDFEDDGIWAITGQPLGQWSCEEKRLVEPVSFETENLHFRNFRNDFNMGMDFWVFALPRELASWEAISYEL